MLIFQFWLTFFIYEYCIFIMNLLIYLIMNGVMFIFVFNWECKSLILCYDIHDLIICKICVWLYY
jgi:hypothetical protein